MKLDMKQYPYALQPPFLPSLGSAWWFGASGVAIVFFTFLYSSSPLLLLPPPLLLLLLLLVASTATAAIAIAANVVAWGDDMCLRFHVVYVFFHV